MSRYLKVTLTEAQADALISAVAYCTAAGPEDWGQDDGPEGHRLQATLDRAGDAIVKAMRPKPRTVNP